MAHRVEQEYARAHPEYAGLVYLPLDVRTGVVGDLRIVLCLLLGAAATLALITSANMAGLLLARAKARAGEIGTRLAVGATPARLARQFLTESVLLSAIAGALGFLLGMLALNPILALIPPDYIGEESKIHATPAAFFLSMTVALVMGILFGLAPALSIFAARCGHQSPPKSYEVGYGTANWRHTTVSAAPGSDARICRGGERRADGAHVPADDVVGTGLSPGSRAHDATELPELKYREGIKVTIFFRELLRRVHEIPGVVDVAASSIRPMESGALRKFSIQGRFWNASGRATADYRVITPSYFAVLRTPLVAGRLLTKQDVPGAPGVALVNERFAQTYFPKEDPLGKRIRLEDEYYTHGTTPESPLNEVVEIVGVVKDSRQIVSHQVHDLNDPASPEIYVPLWQHAETARDLAILLRTRLDPAAFAGPVRQQVLAMDGEQPVYGVQTLRELADVALGPTRLCLLVLAAFAGTALLTACMGLYAIVSYSVTPRTHEVGIRMALGARPRDVLRLVTRDVIAIIAAGLITGLTVSLGVTRLMSSLLFGVATNDGVTLLAVSAILMATALLATYIPARRAVGVDPISTLRCE